MEATIFSHNIEVSPRLRQYVQKKTDRLDRYMPSIIELRVDLTEQNARNADQRKIAQLTVRDKRGTILRAEENHADIFAAVDNVVDKMYRQIKRYRGKRLDRRNRGAGDELDWNESEPVPIDNEGELNPESVIMRRKRFETEPMYPEEAIEQMELLGHDFFVFHNVEENGLNVLYRRKDGNYGLLQPNII